MPLIDAGGVRLHYQRLGAPSERRPVVMIHGLLVGSLATWFFTAAPALARDREVLLYDLRGHGRSERPAGGYDLATQRRDLEGLLAALEIAGPVDLVGHSYGGLVALSMALAHPGRVGRLAVVEAPLPPSSATTDLGLPASADPAALAAALPEPLQAALAQGGRRARRLVQGLVALSTETELLSALQAEPDLDPAALAALDLPLLALYGRASSCLPAADRLAAAPQARVRLLDGGHYLPTERPAEVSAALQEHLDG